MYFCKNDRKINLLYSGQHALMPSYPIIIDIEIRHFLLPNFQCLSFNYATYNSKCSQIFMYLYNSLNIWAHNVL